MSQYTQAEALEQWAAWKACSLALANNQSYTLGDKTWTRADGETVRQNLQYWQGQLYLAEQTGNPNSRWVYASFPSC